VFYDPQSSRTWAYTDQTKLKEQRFRLLKIPVPKIQDLICNINDLPVDLIIIAALIGLAQKLRRMRKPGEDSLPQSVGTHLLYYKQSLLLTFKLADLNICPWT